MTTVEIAPDQTVKIFPDGAVAKAITSDTRAKDPTPKVTEKANDALVDGMHKAATVLLDAIDQAAALDVSEMAKLQKRLGVDVTKRSSGIGGIHGHPLMREKSTTKTEESDHVHVFKLPNGGRLTTASDGNHDHRLASDDASVTAEDGAHSHVVTLENGDKIKTSTDGEHSHELMVSTTTADGVHKHTLKLADGTLLTSMDGADVWVDIGKPPQQHDHPWPVFVPRDPQGERMGNLRIDIGSPMIAKAQNGAYKRTITFERRAKSAESNGFPEMCSVCKSAPASSQIFGDSWGEWIDTCITCADSFVPKELEHTPEGTDVQGWPQWPSLLDVFKRDVADYDPAQPWRSEVEFLTKAEEKREVTGIVLEPGEVDAQNDTIKASVIERAAKQFLASYGQPSGTKLGLMHKAFGDVGLELVESFIAKADTKIGGKRVKKGSWIMTVKVISDALWKRVKAGLLTGFSIGGVAAVRDPKAS